MVSSPATLHPASLPTFERLGPASGASAAGGAAGAAPQGDAIVALLALMLRGLLTGAPHAGVNA